MCYYNTKKEEKPMQVFHPLKPIYNSESKVLILGTMPSVKSRELNFIMLILRIDSGIRYPKFLKLK